MQLLRSRCIDFVRDERGATAIEYGFVVALVSLTIVVWATQIGDSITSILQRAAASLKG